MMDWMDSTILIYCLQTDSEWKAFGFALGALGNTNASFWRYRDAKCVNRQRCRDINIATMYTVLISKWKIMYVLECRIVSALTGMLCIYIRNIDSDSCLLCLRPAEMTLESIADTPQCIHATWQFWRKHDVYFLRYRFYSRPVSW